MATTRTTTTTTAVELPDERRWQGRDWGKLAIAGLLAASLLRPGLGTVAPAAAPDAPAAAAPTAAAVAPTIAAPTAAIPSVEAPQILLTREIPPPGPYLIRGSGAPGSQVRVSVGGQAAGVATVGADGTWAQEITLAEGQNEIVAEALDGSGAAVGSDTASIATAAAAAPTAAEAPTAVAAPAELAAPAIDPLGDGLAAGPATIGGTGAPGGTVRVTIDGAEAGAALVGPDGRWSLDTSLPAGEVEIVAEALDEAGAVAAAGEPLRVTVGAGGALVIAAPAEGDQLEPGPLAVSGTGRPGTELEVLNSDQVVGEATVGADGSWATEVELPQGTAVISVREKGSDQVAGRPIRVTVGEAEAANSCTELAVSCTAYVTRAGGLVLRMRSEGRIADNVIARLPIGSEMLLLEGPSAADGFTWWRVRTLGGNEGWVAGENLVLQPD